MWREFAFLKSLKYSANEFLKKNNVSSLVKNEDDLAKQIELNLNNASVKNFNNIIDSYGLEIFNNTLNKVKNFINDEIK